MSFTVVDRDGNEIEIPDGSPIPPGCRLSVALTLMDSKDRAAIAALRQLADGDGDGEKLSDEEQAERRRADAYRGFKTAIDTANINRRFQTPLTARRAPVADPSWQKPGRWQPRGPYGNDAAADPYEIDDKLAGEIFAARHAYNKRISAGMHRHRIGGVPPPHADSLADAEKRKAQSYLAMKQRLGDAYKVRCGDRISPPAATDAAAAERRAHIERLQRAFAPRPTGA